jgi:uncharacterized protein YdaT
MTAKIISIMSKKSKEVVNDSSSRKAEDCLLHTDRTLVEESLDQIAKMASFAATAEKNARTKERLKAERAKDNEITMKAYGIK